MRPARPLVGQLVRRPLTLLALQHGTTRTCRHAPPCTLCVKLLRTAIVCKKTRTAVYPLAHGKGLAFCAVWGNSARFRLSGISS